MFFRSSVYKIELQAEFCVAYLIKHIELAQLINNISRQKETPVSALITPALITPVLKTPFRH